MQYYVYILANATNVALYTGVTRDLVRRVYEHRNCVDSNSFTARYHIHKLVYFEETSDVRSAIQREKQIKSWSRKKKKALIAENYEKLKEFSVCTNESIHLNLDRDKSQ
jgi:putative endonuclease